MLFRYGLKISQYPYDKKNSLLLGKKITVHTAYIKQCLCCSIMIIVIVSIAIKSKNVI